MRINICPQSCTDIRIEDASRHFARSNVEVAEASNLLIDCRGGIVDMRRGAISSSAETKMQGGLGAATVKGSGWEECRSRGEKLCCHRSVSLRKLER